MNANVAIAALVVMFLTGCATQQKMSREEFLQATQRTYQDKSPEQIFSASEKLFVLADGDDFTFSHTPDSLLAIRPWSIYLVLAYTAGTDVWTVKASRNEKTGGTDAAVYVTTAHGGSVLPVVVANSGSTATSPGSGGIPTRGNAIYQLFWERLDYLLGLNSKWMSCDDVDKEIANGKLWGDTSPLCNSLNIKDNSPVLEPSKNTVLPTQPS